MADERIDLRTYIFLDSLQYQMASLMATTSRGYYPVALQACMIIEISPGIEINRFTDIALKATNVTPGIQFVERLFGLLEVHSDSQADARQAGAAILKELGRSEEERMKPRVLTSFGNMVLRGDTLYVLEIEPSGYAYFAANEAEKASHINIINVQGVGRFGRVYIAGEEAEVLVSKDIVESRLLSLSGREPGGQAE